MEAELTVGNVSETGADVTIENNTSKKLTTDGRFEINVLGGGQQYEIVIEDENYAVPDTFYIVPNGGSLTVKISWDEMYGKLPEGEYVLNLFTDGGTASANFGIGGNNAVTDLDNFIIVELKKPSTQESVKPDWDEYLPQRGSITSASQFVELPLEDKDVSILMTDIHSYGVAVSYINGRDDNVMYGLSYFLEKKIGGEWYRINL